MLEEDEPLWRKILLNELVLAFLAALIILYIAFSIATRRTDEEEKPRPKKVSALGHTWRPADGR